MRNQLLPVGVSITLLLSCSQATTGISGTGGSSSGGTISTGGSVGTGGTLATGGTSSSGGKTGTGGATNAGGSTGAGGTTSTGGSLGNGGSTSPDAAVGTGGSTVAGGATGSGGVMGTGGLTGSGGTGPKGGGGATASGGVGNGGATASGGAGSGGSTGSGGSCNIEDCLAVACTKTFTAPTFANLKTNAKMPDPFTFMDGTKVATKQDWVCRQKEIRMLAQAFIYGPKPPKPETLTATFSSDTLTLNMGNAGKTWTLTVPIKTPSGTGPFPAMFDVDAGAPSGVASIGTGLSWLTTNVAAAGSGRGATGKFYDFYPNSKDTGSLMAWAWAASRIIDGLEATTGHNIDTKRTYGLGCSRNGKTAATMGLFDDRVAMVAMQSPGSGTTSGWRIAQSQTTSVQTASEIFGETTWMGEQFGQFGGNNVNKLPIDQHEVLALAWPRPILVREGNADSWNCPVCVWTTLKYTQMTYEALGNKDAVGFTQYSGGHCESGGTEWTNTYNAFVKKYITPADSSVSTTGMFTEGKFTFDSAKWQDGTLAAVQ
jgi:hypothetical protein